MAVDPPVLAGSGVGPAIRRVRSLAGCCYGEGPLNLEDLSGKPHNGGRKLAGCCYIATGGPGVHRRLEAALRPRRLTSWDGRRWGRRPSVVLVRSSKGLAPRRTALSRNSWSPKHPMQQPARLCPPQTPRNLQRGRSFAGCCYRPARSWLESKALLQRGQSVKWCKRYGYSLNTVAASREAPSS